jgi:probable O-glycosylation ligase (exosortase A-associated)
MLFIVSINSNKKIGNKEILSKKNSKLLLFFLFLIFISILTSDVTIYAFNTFRAVLGYAIIYFVMIKQLITMGRLKKFFSALILFHIIVVIASPSIIFEPETRSYLSLGSFLGDGNDFSLSVSIVLPLCLFLYLDAKTKTYKLFSIISFVLLTLCIIGTSSRGGFLALSGIILYLFFKSPKKAKAIASIFLLIFIIFLFAPPVFYERMKTIRNYSTESSAASRIMIWKQAIEMAKTHPVLGVGAGHFPVKFGTEFRPPGYPVRGGLPWNTAHSIYFLSLGELGFPGLIFVIAFIVSNLLSNEKHIKSLKQSHEETLVSFQRLSICLNAALIGFAIGGAFLSALYYPHIYVIAGLFTSSEFIFKEISSSDKIKSFEKSNGEILCF